MHAELPACAAGGVWTMRLEQEPRNCGAWPSCPGDTAVRGIIAFLFSLRKLPKQTLRILRSPVKSFSLIILGFGFFKCFLFSFLELLSNKNHAQGL